MASKRIHKLYKDEERNIVYFWKEPKQFKHWLKKAGLIDPNRYESWNRGKNYSNWTDGKRLYRMTCFGELQVSEQAKNFDRWANSCLEITDYSVFKHATNEATFVEAIKKMRKEADLLDPIVK